LTRKLRALVCDDHALFREGLKAVLRDQPLMEVVGEAANGQAAVSEVERLRPDIVIMDIEMPGLDGIEATRRITQSWPEVKVLILTMHVDDLLVARCLEAGAGGYLLKDVPVPQLAYAVEAVAAGRRYLSPAALERVLDERGQPLARTRTRYDLLTGREREVLKLLADGLSLKEVAGRLGRSVKTAEVHTYHLMRKLGVHHRAELIKYAIALGLVRMPVFEEFDAPDVGDERPGH